MKPGIDGLGKQRGASLLAVIFLLVVVAFFGTVVVSLVATQSFTSVNEMQSTQAFYVAEGGLERAVGYFLGPTLAGRVTCAGLPGAATSLNPGLFQLNIETGSPFYSTTATTIPAGGVAAGDTVIPVVSTVNYAPFGRLMIDRELIDYTGTTATSFTGALRGRDGTLAAPHIAGAKVGQNQCTVTSTGGVTDLSAGARGRRVQRAGLQLQEAWAVGDNGVILRWNGVTWALFTATGAPMRSVSMDSYANGWAVGNVVGGLAQIRRWNPDGTPSWDPVAGPVEATVQLNAVQTLAHNEAWAVGNDRGGPPNSVLILHWDGIGWTFFDSLVNQHLYALSMVDIDNDGRADDGWAAGERRGCINPGPTILRWNKGGNNWRCPLPGVLPTTGDQHLRGIFMISGMKGWAVGDRRGCGNPGPTFLRYEAGRWECPVGVILPAVANQADQDLYGIFMLSANDGWAVGATGGGGGAICPTNQARILRWDGATWSCWPSFINQHLRAVACATPNDCWAVGDAGTILHWDGNAWSVHPQSGAVTIQNLRGIHIIGPRARPQAAWREVVN